MSRRKAAIGEDTPYICGPRFARFTKTRYRSVSIYTLTASKTSLLDVKHKMKHSKLPVSLVQDAFGNAKNNEQESSDDTLAVSSTDESKQSSVPVTPAARPKTIKMYTDESLLSFFRRPGFSPDGSLFLTPAACLGVSSIEEGADNKDDNNFGAIMYTRGSLLK